MPPREPLARSRGGRRRRALEVAPKADRWMISYADLVTLLLAVFIVLFMSSEMQRGNEAAVGLRSGFVPRAAADVGPHEAERSSSVEPAAVPSAVSVYAEGEPIAVDPGEMSRIASQVETFVALAGLEDQVRTRLERRGLVVSLIEAGFFDAGFAVPRDEALPVLDSLGRLLAGTAHHIRVEGHTDDTPIRTARFPSNWELSTARATWLIEHLSSHLGLRPDRLSAAGYGEFRPIASNDSASGRARNRRVDIVLLSNDAAVDEPPVGGIELSRDRP